MKVKIIVFVCMFGWVGAEEVFKWRGLMLGCPVDKVVEKMTDKEQETLSVNDGDWYFNNGSVITKLGLSDGKLVSWSMVYVNFGDDLGANLRTLYQVMSEAFGKAPNHEQAMKVLTSPKCRGKWAVDNVGISLVSWLDAFGMSCRLGVVGLTDGVFAVLQFGFFVDDAPLEDSEEGKL